MKNSAIDRTSEIFRADQVSMCRSCSRARRGPRPGLAGPRGVRGADLSAGRSAGRAGAPPVEPGGGPVPVPEPGRMAVPAPVAVAAPLGAPVAVAAPLGVPVAVPTTAVAPATGAAVAVRPVVPAGTPCAAAA